MLNVTATNPAGPGWVKVVPTGSVPAEVSNINVEQPGQILANLVTVQLPTSGPNAGQVDIVCYDPLDVVVDIAGAYVPATTSGRYVGLEQSVRVLDTRDNPGRTKVGGGQVQHVDLWPVPNGATAVVVNLTVTESNGPGFWTAFVPGAAVPIASNVNTDEADQTRANQAILPIVGNNRSIDVFSYSGGHLVVDVAGYFTAQNPQRPDDGLFVPNTPVPRHRHPPGRALRPDVPEVGLRVRLQRDARRPGRGDQPDHERDPRPRVVRRVRGPHRPAGPRVEPQRQPGRTRPSPTTRSPGRPPPASRCTPTPVAT